MKEKIIKEVYNRITSMSYDDFKGYFQLSDYDDSDVDYNFVKVETNMLMPLEKEIKEIKWDS